MGLRWAILVQCGAALTSPGWYSGQHLGQPWSIVGHALAHLAKQTLLEHRKSGPWSQVSVFGWLVSGSKKSKPLACEAPPSPKNPSEPLIHRLFCSCEARSVCSPRARDKTKVTRGRPFFGLSSACGRLWLVGMFLGCLGLSCSVLGLSRACLAMGWHPDRLSMASRWLETKQRCLAMGPTRFETCPGQA